MTDVETFLATIDDERRQRDARLLVELMTEVTGEQPAMWGSAIVGFGARHYRYESGREGDVAAIGFSPRKAQTTLYLTGYMESYADLLERLGPHKTGKGCLYLKRVDQADQKVLRDIVARSFEQAQE
ncbi:hypothetical protein Ade02nite_03470 [Paractinoplanes deccanensis]|uniref:YdhG-like domain-containing protein n=1 Tax=Paractinoplanes deccanensis TaxID=113561 RepID=A0ABQ3XVF6_9ACTN|nr:DUF1801 domain-containing protein [Actinoplanes deccanensis]GID71706.1 hypothetical protein Ade02nite_03470 [Actinoplanes deccanensis]